MEAFSRGIEIHRRIFTDIRDVFKLYSTASTIFNCTGLGSLTLGGVEDKKLYPARVSHITHGVFKNRETNQYTRVKFY